MRTRSAVRQYAARQQSQPAKLQQHAPLPPVNARQLLLFSVHRQVASALHPAFNVHRPAVSAQRLQPNVQPQVPSGRQVLLQHVLQALLVHPAASAVQAAVLPALQAVRMVARAHQAVQAVRPVTVAVHPTHRADIVAVVVPPVVVMAAEADALPVAVAVRQVAARHVDNCKIENNVLSHRRYS